MSNTPWLVINITACTPPDVLIARRCCTLCGMPNMFTISSLVRHPSPHILGEHRYARSRTLVPSPRARAGAASRRESNGPGSSTTTSVLHVRHQTKFYLLISPERPPCPYPLSDKQMRALSLSISGHESKVVILFIIPRWQTSARQLAESQPPNARAGLVRPLTTTAVTAVLERARHFLKSHALQPCRCGPVLG